LDLNDYLRVISGRWISIITVAVGCVGVALLMIIVSPVSYRAATQTLLMVVEGNSPGELVSGSSFTQSQVESFAVVAKSTRVLQPAMMAAGLDETINQFSARISTQVPIGTAIITVYATDSSPQTAAAIADAVADQLVTAVGDMTPTAKDGTRLVKATVISPAQVPQVASSPPKKRMLLAGLGAGLVLGYGQGLVRDLLGRRLRTAKDVEQVTSAPVIGKVRFDPDADETLLWLPAEDQSNRHADFRQLHTNLRFLGVGSGRPGFVITSPNPGEGKTTIAVNLAVTIAREGTDVLLVDADLRDPSLSRRLGSEAAEGLTTVLAGRQSLEETVRPTQANHLWLLASGPRSPNPAVMLASTAGSALFEQAKKSFGCVIVDAPAISAGPDAAILVKALGDVIMVVRASQTTGRQLARAVNRVEEMFGQLWGVVLNRLRPQDRREH
jgi:capsular exopolysaccharide synthesis family protein